MSADWQPWMKRGVLYPAIEAAALPGPGAAGDAEAHGARGDLCHGQE